MLQEFLKKALLKLAIPKLEKILYAEVPVSPPSRTRQPLLSRLPGNTFDPKKILLGSCKILPSGKLLLTSGDYLIPVMTYCMKSHAGSPDHHLYQLATLYGAHASEIEILNRKAITDSSIRDIQELSWAIQNGIPFEQMSEVSQQIIIKIMPELKGKFEEDFLTKIHKNWDTISKFIPAAPTFETAIDISLTRLGDIGEVVKNIISIRQKVLTEGARYETFAKTITFVGLSPNLGNQKNTPWSQIQDNVFARFLTEGHYGDPGILQVRVADSKDAIEFNPYCLIADPGTSQIQPLTFSMINPAWILALPLSEAALFAILAFAILTTDWKSIIAALEKIGANVSAELQEIVDEANRLLSEKHDELEKPAKDLGILDDAKQIREGNYAGARNYEKPGGSGARDRDFGKFEGEEIDRPNDGIKMKTLPDGTKVISRDETGDGIVPTLEIQSPTPGAKIKIRYR